MNKKSGLIDYRSQIDAKIATFPAVPAMCGQLISKLNDPHADFRKLADEMKYDPGMTANVLRLANSAYFGSSGKIDSLQMAFVRFGLKKLFQLVTTVAVSGILNKPLIGYDLEPEEFLKHSIWTAVASEEFATALKLSVPAMLFTAGLLHDIGKIVLDSLIKDEWGELKEGINNEEFSSFEEIEHAVLGIDHAEAGARILASWSFPEELISAIRWHHDPEKAEKHQTLVNIIHVADVLAYSEGIGSGVDGFHYHVSEKTINDLKLKTAIIERVSCHTLGKMEEIERLLR